MEFVEDLNLEDYKLTYFPRFKPGQPFSKGWRIRNTGTCSWNSTYFINYVRGSDPAAQMGGQPTSVRGVVQPGQTYDMYVDLVAPQVPGKYVGYWQMHNTAGIPFGQTVWVAIEVPQPTATPPPPTATVPPTAVPTSTSPPAPTETAAPTATQIPPQPTANIPGADLLETTWVMAGYLADMANETLTPAIQDVDVTLLFSDDGTLTGSAGCNSFSGSYLTDGKNIAITDIIASRLICEQPAGIMEQEADFLALLEEVQEYRFNQQNQLEMITYVIENDQRVEKILLVFYDLLVGP